LSAFRLLLFLAFSLLSFQATRNSHQFAAVVGTITAWNFGEWAAAIARTRAQNAGIAEDSPPRLAPRVLTLSAVAVVFVALASGWLYKHAAEGRTIAFGEEPLWYPHGAVRFAGKREFPPRFLGFHLGHNALYEYYHGPERKVYADARLEVMGPELYTEYGILQHQLGGGDKPGARPSWESKLDGLGRPVVMADLMEAPSVAAMLLSHSEWRCLWFDPIVAVFVHESFAKNEPAVDFGARHFSRTREFTPQSVPTLLASAKGIRNVASGLQSHGRPNVLRALLALGLDYARAARTADPGPAEAWKMLGQLEFLREPPPGRDPIPRFRMAFDPVFDLGLARASYNWRQALERAPNDFSTLMYLAQIDLARGMNETALPLLERLLQLAPINAQQTELQAGLIDQIPVLRERLGPAPSLPKPANRDEHDRLLAALLASGRAGSAADLIERDYPPEARSWEQADRLATLRLHLGEPARARATWQAAPASQPAIRLARIAASYLVEDHFNTARRAYNEALAAQPNLFEALYGLAVTEQDAGHAAAALAAAREAQGHAPGDVAQSAAQNIAVWVQPYASRN
jgi:tetratricopeptide (TPR) repeat protein